MKAELEDWKDGWKGLSIGLSNAEIEHLIGLLQKIQSDNDQHFHINSECKGAPGLGGIEVYVKPDEQDDNMYFSSLALAPGQETS